MLELNTFTLLMVELQCKFNSLPPRLSSVNVKPIRKEWNPENSNENVYTYPNEDGEDRPLNSSFLSYLNKWDLLCLENLEWPSRGSCLARLCWWHSGPTTTILFGDQYRLGLWLDLIQPQRLRNKVWPMKRCLMHQKYYMIIFSTYIQKSEE